MRHGQSRVGGFWLPQGVQRVHPGGWNRARTALPNVGNKAEQGNAPCRRIPGYPLPF
jgi:hypothetical protein